MHIQIDKGSEVVRISLDGEMIGGPDATRLAETFHELIENGHQKILMDMEKVSWMNSSGLGILIGGLTTLRNAGGDLKLLNLAKKIQDLLRITKLLGIFEVYTNEEEAIASFN